MATILGVDYGHKKIGFATGQTITGNASPLTVVKQNGEMWRTIDKIFDEWHIKTVVVGEPKLADGKEHPLEKAIQQFMQELTKRYNVTIYREDETLTSYEASEYQEYRRGKENPLLDAHAAAIFLESWMRENI